jgi:hypothetical protein
MIRKRGNLPPLAQERPFAAKDRVMDVAASLSELGYLASHTAGSRLRRRPAAACCE